MARRSPPASRQPCRHDGAAVAVLLAMWTLVAVACGTEAPPAPTLTSAAGGAGGEADAAAVSDGGAQDTVQAAEVTILADAGTPPADTAAADAAASADTAGDTATAVDTASAPDTSLPPDAAAAGDSAAAADAAAPVDTAAPAAKCGDGICQAGSESASTCAADCGPPPASGWQACAACTAQIDACTKASPACAGFAQCALACKDLACMSACDKVVDYATLSGYVVPLAKCLVNAGCVAPMAAGPAGAPTSCGNKACDGGETHLTCPADCPFPVATWELCQAQYCAKSYDTCATSAACIAVATCWNQYKSQQCLQGTGGQQLAALIQCAQSKCGNVPTSASCAGKCGVPAQQNAYCQCDSACKQYGDCCPDYATLCK